MAVIIGFAFLALVALAPLLNFLLDMRDINKDRSLDDEIARIRADLASKRTDADGE